MCSAAGAAAAAGVLCVTRSNDVERRRFEVDDARFGVLSFGAGGWRRRIVDGSSMI